MLKLQHRNNQKELTMIPTQTQVAAHARGFIKVLQAFAAQEFDINVDDMIFKVNFTKDSCVWGLGGDDFKNGKRVGFMSLNLRPIVTYEIAGYNEYKSLNRYRDISSFETSEWTLWLEALMCHEMAHVVQHMLPHSNSKLKIGEPKYITTGRKRLRLEMVCSFKGLGQSETGHGDFFKVIYAKFRRQFINSKVNAAGRPVTSFIGDNGEQVVRTVVRKTAHHPLIGSKFPFNGETFEVKECYPRMRTYPLLAVGTSTGKRIRFSPLSIRMYQKQAA
jgi:hypothetical protein